jgi:hypothetical protein
MTHINYTHRSRTHVLFKLTQCCPLCVFDSELLMGYVNHIFTYAVQTFKKVPVSSNLN